MDAPPATAADPLAQPTRARAVHAAGLRVCALHEGITRGRLERIAPTGELTAFVPRDPDQAGCLVDVVLPAVR